MLVKSHCELIARRSVLSAPDIFLPRLLLCCGLPQSSFTTILDRLHDLGQSAPDKGKHFRQLLSSSSGLGVLKRHTIVRMLMGRISAYSSLLSKTDSLDEKMLATISSSCFISWLEAECVSAKQKISTKKRTHQDFHYHSSMISSLLKKEIHDNTTIHFSKEETFIPLRNLDDIERINLSEENGKTKELTNETIRHLLERNSFEELDRMLAELYDNYVEKYQTDKNGSSLENISTTLLVQCRKLQDRHKDLDRFILHWIPILTKECNEVFWEIFFNNSRERKVHSYEFENLILTRCLAAWSTIQITACQRWILNQTKLGRSSNLHIDLCLKCFLVSVKQIEHNDVNETNHHQQRSIFTVLEPKDQTESAVTLALLGAQQWSTRSNLLTKVTNEPPWMLLLILI